MVTKPGLLGTSTVDFCTLLVYIDIFLLFKYKFIFKSIRMKSNLNKIKNVFIMIQNFKIILKTIIQYSINININFKINKI